MTEDRAADALRRTLAAYEGEPDDMRVLTATSRAVAGRPDLTQWDGITLGDLRALPALLAEAWERGHFYCAAEQASDSRCGNPYRAEPAPCEEAEPHPCGHRKRTPGCGGCDPGAIEYVRDDGGPWRRAEPSPVGAGDRCLPGCSMDGEIEPDGSGTTWIDHEADCPRLAAAAPTGEGDRRG